MTAEELAKFMDELAERLGPAALHIWEVTVKQIYLESFGWIVFDTLILIAIAVLTVVTVIVWVKNRDTTASDGEVVLNGTTIFVNLLAVPVLVWSLVSSFVTLLNVEYHAIQRLIP